MNVADTLYVVVGYKLDQASARQIEQHFERMRDLAQGVAKGAQSVNTTLRTYTQGAARASRATQDYASRQREAASASEAMGSKGGIALKTLAAGVTALAAAGGASLATSLFNRFEQQANEVRILAAATNTTTEAFGSMAAVARSVGVEVDNLRDGFNDLSEKTSEAFIALKEGKKDNEYLKVFKELNIDLATFTKLKPDERFEQFADAINRVQDPGRRSAIVMKLMSDEGTKFFPIFNKGSAAIAQMRREAVEMGAVLGPQGAQALGTYNAALSRFSLRIDALANRLGAEALPLLTDALNTLLAEIGPGELRAVGDALVDGAKDFHKVAVPAIKDLIAMGKAGRDLARDLGGIGNILKLLAIGILALKAPALVATWGAQASGVLALAKALASLVLSLGASGTAMAVLKAQMLAMGKAAALAAGKMALVAIPLFAFEDYAAWSEGGESVIGAIFGERTQANIDAVHDRLLLVALAFAGLTALVVGLPAAAAVGLAAVAAYAYDSAEHFEMFFRGLFGLLGLLVQQILDSVKGAARAVFVDLPSSLGEALNERLRGIAYLGSAGSPAPSAAADAVAQTVNNTRSVSSSQAITVQVDARGTTDPAAVGAAAQGGTLDAARQLKTQYDTGLQ